MRCLSLRRKFASRLTLGRNPSYLAPCPLPLSLTPIHIRRRPMFTTRTETLCLASVALAYSLPRARRIAPFCTHPRFPSETRIPDFSISRISRTVARVDLGRSVDPYRCSGISCSRVISAFVSDVRLCPTSVSNSTMSFHRRRRPLRSSSRRRDSRSNPARATNRRRVVKTRSH